MSLETNKATVTRIYTEVNDAQRYDVLDEICTADIIIHDPVAGELRGLEAFKGVFAFFRQAFPEQRSELLQYLAEGDYVALLHIHHAVNNGSFNGRPPTGRTVVVPGVELFRFERGKIAEFWRFDADLSLMMQLGALPVPAGV
jgi:predicted ester cyclase